MRLVKGELQKLKSSALVDKSAYVEAKMTGNPNFVNPSPKILDITAARTALTAALEAAEDRSPAKIVVRNQARTALMVLLAALVRYVNSASAGDENVAVSSGFMLAKKPDPVDQLEAPKNLQASFSSYAGGVDLRWERVRHARMYQVYMTAGDPASEQGWAFVGVTSKAKFTKLELESGKLYNFRVTALGRVGEGPASENAGKRAA